MPAIRPIGHEERLSLIEHLDELRTRLIWCVVAFVFVILASLTGPNLDTIPRLPMWFRDLVNASSKATIYSLGTTAVLVVLYLFRSWFVKPTVAWSIWNLMLLFLGLSMPDANFYSIVAKPDNVPIVALVFLLAFFTWLATYRAVENDRRKEQGLPPLEKEGSEKVLVWPDLVYTELICMIALTAFLTFWAISLQAPLEDLGDVPGVQCNVSVPRTGRMPRSLSARRTTLDPVFSQRSYRCTVARGVTPAA